MAVWFTSDQHYDHRNIIQYCKRPFKDVTHMIDEMVNRHNELVAPDDTVWHLGDFCLNAWTVERVLRRLNGRHNLVCGNHDAAHPCKKSSARFIEDYKTFGFHTVQTETRMTLPGLGEALLHHMPYKGDPQLSERYKEWRPQKGSEVVLIHGHVHEKWRTRPGLINVGVDVWDYRPVSMEQLIQTISTDVVSST